MLLIELAEKFNCYNYPLKIMSTVQTQPVLQVRERSSQVYGLEGESVFNSKSALIIN